MNRRSFLSTLLGGAAVALDPERLLWVPGKKLISIPKRGNVILTPEIYARLVLMDLRRDLTIARAMSRDFKIPIGAPIDGTVHIRKPYRFVNARSGVPGLQA